MAFIFEDEVKSKGLDIGNEEKMPRNRFVFEDTIPVNNRFEFENNSTPPGIKGLDLSNPPLGFVNSPHGATGTWNEPGVVDKAINYARATGLKLGDLYQQGQREAQNLETYLKQPQEPPTGVKDFLTRTLPESALRTAKGLAELPRTIGESIAEPIATNILDVYHGEKTVPQAWGDIGKEEAQKVYEGIKGFGEFLGKPIGTYGLQELKKSWVEHPVESGLALSSYVLPIAGRTGREEIANGVNTVLDKAKKAGWYDKVPFIGEKLTSKIYDELLAKGMTEAEIIRTTDGSGKARPSFLREAIRRRAAPDINMPTEMSTEPIPQPAPGGFKPEATGLRIEQPLKVEVPRFEPEPIIKVKGEDLKIEPVIENPIEKKPIFSHEEEIIVKGKKPVTLESQPKKEMIASGEAKGQAQNIINKPKSIPLDEAIPTEFEPLILEARKYNTVDGFISSFKQVYHGTNLDFEEPGQGIWLAESKRQAMAHGKNLKEYYIRPENTVDLRENPQYIYDPQKGEPDFQVQHIKGFQESPSYKQISGKVYTKQQLVDIYNKAQNITSTPKAEVTQNKFANKELFIMHNPEKSPNMGERFNQHLEPSGKYVQEMDNPNSEIPKNWEKSIVKFINPLIVESDGSPQWKKDLSEKYKATGKKLSNLLLKKGYDGIITIDKNGQTGEIVILDKNREHKEILTSRIVYHATNIDIDNFKPYTFFAERPSDANKYITKKINKNKDARIYKTKLNIENPLEILDSSAENPAYIGTEYIYKTLHKVGFNDEEILNQLNFLKETESIQEGRLGRKDYTAKELEEIKNGDSNYEYPAWYLFNRGRNLNQKLLFALTNKGYDAISFYDINSPKDIYNSTSKTWITLKEHKNIIQSPVVSENIPKNILYINPRNHYPGFDSFKILDIANKLKMHIKGNVGTLKDILEAPKLIKLFKPVLDTKIEISEAMPKEHENINYKIDAAIFKDDKGHYTIKLFSKHITPELVLDKIVEEATHALHDAKGRRFSSKLKAQTLEEHEQLSEEKSAKKMLQYVSQIMEKYPTHEDIIKEAIKNGETIPIQQILYYREKDWMKPLLEKEINKYTAEKTEKVLRTEITEAFGIEGSPLYSIKYGNRNIGEYAGTNPKKAILNAIIDRQRYIKDYPELQKQTHIMPSGEVMPGAEHKEPLTKEEKVNAEEIRGNEKRIYEAGNVENAGRGKGGQNIYRNIQKQKTGGETVTTRSEEGLSRFSSIFPIDDIDAFKTSSDNINRAIKMGGNLTSTIATIPKIEEFGLADLDNISRKLISNMLAVRLINPEIFNSIIKSIPIDMMNDLISSEGSIENLFNDKSMFMNKFTTDLFPPITRFDRSVALAFFSGIESNKASLIAKFSFIPDIAWISDKSLSAKVAKVFDFHKDSLLQQAKKIKNKIENKTSDTGNEIKLETPATPILPIETKIKKGIQERESLTSRKQLAKPPVEMVTVGDLGLKVGDKFKIHGEQYAVKEKDEEGNYLIEDGDKFIVDEFDKIPIPDEGSLKKGKYVQSKLLEGEKTDIKPKMETEVQGQKKLGLQKIELHAGLPPKVFKPVIKYGKDIKEGLQALFLPSAISPEHLKVAQELGALLGETFRKQEIANTQLKPSSKMFDRLGVHKEGILETNPGIKFASDMSQGRPMEGRFQIANNKIISLFQKELKGLEEANIPLEKVRENYFPNIVTEESHRAFNQALTEAFNNGIGSKESDLNQWTKEQKNWVKNRVEELLKTGEGSDIDALQYLSKRPFTGSENYRKPKTFDDIMTAIEFGLKPISNNPIDIVKLKLAEIDKSIMANKFMEKQKTSGNVEFLKIGKELPSGFEFINDKYGKVYYRNDKGELVISGYYVAKKPVADILNNYLSTSLYNSRYFGTLYKGAMFVANSLNQAQLGGGSMFHGGFMESEVVISSLANVIKDSYRLVTGKGTFKDVGKSIVTMVTSPVMAPIKGGKLLEGYLNPELIDNPEIQAVAKAYELGGGKAYNERALETHQIEQLMRDWYAGHKVRVALRSPVAFNELLAMPIMRYFVPRMKIWAFGELATRIIRDNPGKTLEELTPQFRQAVNRIDARMGQVGYSRLFTNNIAKNFIQILVRAPGWTGGTIAEIGGSFKDTYQFFNDWGSTGKIPEQFPDRIAYTIALILGTMTINGLLTYLFTGEKPHDMDYWAFRDGGKDIKGRPTRWLLPTYAKDVFAYYQNTGGTLINKLNPLMFIIASGITNKDYYNTEIRHPDDPYRKQILDFGKWVVKQYVPFWIRGEQKVAESGGGIVSTLKTNPERVVAPEFGVMPATSAYTKTPLEKKLDEILAKKSSEAPRTKEEFDKSQLKARLRSEYLDGNRNTTRQALRNGDITLKDIPYIETPTLQYNFKRLTFEEAEKVWEVANPQEKNELNLIYRQKYLNKRNELINRRDKDELELKFSNSLLK